MRLGGLEASLHPNLLERPQPAEAPGAFEKRGRQVLARLADGDRGDERGGGRYRSAFACNQTLQRPPLPMDGMVWQHLKHVGQLQVAAGICAIGTMGTGKWFTDSIAGSGFDNQRSDPASPFRSQDPLHRPC